MIDCMKIAGTRRGWYACGAAIAGALLMACSPVTHTVRNPDGSVAATIEASHGAAIESNATVRLSVGDSIAVHLQSNPTTGYLWEPQYAETNKVLSVGETEFVLDAATAGLEGAGGTFVARFKALSPGTARIRMIYQRPFERESAPAKTFEFTAVVGQ